MHPIHEYIALTKQSIAQANQMIACLPPGSPYTRATNVLTFLLQHGCCGWPGDQIGCFECGPWLNRVGYPAKQHDAVTIVPCFSDDVAPTEASNTNQSTEAGQCLYTDQVIVLHHVNQWSLPELALILLHEGRHARHDIGPRLAGLLPLDPDAFHETNTWMMVLNILEAWGGATWQRAVQQEVARFRDLGLASEQPNQIAFPDSQHYWPEVDTLFGVTSYENVRQARQKLVALTAHMQYWSERNATLRPENILHSLITRGYQS